MFDQFPPDVRFRFEGDKNLVEESYRDALHLFYKASLQHDTNTNAPTQLVRYLPDGGYISVLLINTQKIVTIMRPPVEVTTTETEQEINPQSLYVLCGMETTPTTVTVSGKKYLRTYRPSLATSISHRIPNLYHDNARLAETDGKPKPGAFSGAIKRVVAAVLGLGKILPIGHYLTPQPSNRIMKNNYTATHASTYGVYKAGVRRWWLVEISATRGILAMPLPIIGITRSKSYRENLRQLGDTGGLAICEEFGGLPSGETFPTGTDLTTAITNGKVLRIATATDLEPYYKSTINEAHTYWHSWAFSESGREAHNVRYVYKKRSGDPKYSIGAQHWGISITLSNYDLSVTAPTPVGAGSATLQMYHDGKLDKKACKQLWGGTNQLAPILQNYTSSTLDIMDIDELYFPIAYVPDDGLPGWGAVVHVFFDGDRLERVKWHPPARLAGFFRYEVVTVPIPPWEFPMTIGNPCGAVGYGADIRNGYIWSPSGYSSSSVDLRLTDVSYTEYVTDYVVINPGTSFVGPPPQTLVCIPVDGDLFDYAFTTRFGIPRGFGEHNGKPNQLHNIIAIVPGSTREGVVIARHSEFFGPNTKAGEARGFFTGLGQVQIPYTAPATTFAPHAAFPMFFDVSINPGPTKSYIITKGISAQNEIITGLPSVDPGWNNVDTLPATASVAPKDVTFIGSY